MKLKKFSENLCAISCNVSLLLNSFLPFFATVPVHAEELEPTPIVQSTPAPTPEVAINETTAEPTAEPTAVPTNTEPVEVPTGVPTNTEPVEVPSEEPINGEPSESTPEPTIVTEATPTPILTETPAVPTVSPINSAEPTENPSVTPEPTSPSNSDIGTQNPVVETNPSPTVIPVIEKTCLTGGEIIEDVPSEGWNINDKTGVSETKENVKLGVRYVYPQDNRVTIIFKCLPTDESVRTPLKIQKVKTSELKLPENLGNVEEYAYDITTGMTNGAFEYDVTLPKPENSTAEISYIEKSADDAKNNEIKVDEVKQVEESKIEQQSTAVKALSLDHFTLFIVSNGALLSVSGSFNGVTQVTVNPSTSIEVDLTVQRTGSDSNNDWESTSWKIDEGSWICEDHADHEWFDGTSSESFNITAPSTVGTYDVSFRAHRDDSCGNTGVSNTFTLTDGIIVSNTPSIVTPVLPNNPSDDYALTSVSGVWTSVSGGSNVIGTNTNEVRWGNSTGSGQSGLRFDGSGVQTFNTGSNFYLGALTHFNWPITNAANGAKLKITLQFSKPSISPNPDFSYDFVIDETTNNWPCSSGWQQSDTACDDKISFPTSYGSKSFTIDDKLYTLRIVGFVNSYPSGSPVSQFITEEQKNNTAYLVGTLSSVLVERPDISIIKKTNDQDISSAPGENLNVGDAVNWSYIIQNTGNVNLSGVSVVDNPTTPISCPKNSLLSGESMTCTASGTVQSGQFTNTATVTANHSTGTVSKSDSSWYFGIPRNICGDGVVNQNTEECDNGSSNGSVCTPTYGNSCNYCSVSCQNISVTGPYCGDGIMNGDEQCDGTDLGGLSSTDFRCNSSCQLELINTSVTICHATSASDNPYVTQSPNIQNNGDLTGGHLNHTGGVYPVSGWGDIIPPYVFIGGTFPGRNWSTAGQAIWNNGCVVPPTNATLIVKKHVINDNGGLRLAGDFTLKIGNTYFTGNENGTSFTIPTGSYSVSETQLTGYEKTSDNCTGTIAAGQTKTCTIVNDDLSPKLKLIKIVDNKNVGTAVPSNWTLSAVGTSGFNDSGNSTTYHSVKAGVTYMLSESSGPTGYNASWWSCDGGEASGNTVLLSLGESVTCSITNTVNTGKITIVKDAINNSEDNFRFDTNLPHPNGYFELEDDGNISNGGTPEKRSFTLPVGSYWVDERSYSDDNWALTDLECTGDNNASVNLSTGKATINLDADEDVTCTYTNTKLGSITLSKDTNPEQNSGNRTYFDYSGTLGNGSLYDGDTDTFGSLLPGSYTITEAQTPGWYLKDIVCSGSDSVSKDIPNRTITISLKAGESSQCEFKNYKKGRIEGEKFYDKNGNSHDDGSGERGLENWKIFIDENSNGLHDSDERFDMTDHDGDYSFDNLMPATYRVCEEMQSGWYPVSGSNCQNTTINNDGGDINEVNFANRQFGSIKVCKIIIDGSGKVVNGSETPDTSFTINWNNGLSPTVFNTGHDLTDRLLKSTPRGQKDAYCTTIDNLRITNYRYSQETISDSSIWEKPKYNDQYNETINDIGDFYTYNQNTNSNGDINLALDPPGIDRTLVILNQYKFGEVEVFKFNDLNGNGKRDCIDFNSSDDTRRIVECQMEPLLPEWTINLSGTSKVTDTNGSVSFGNLSPKTYILSEDIKGGWTQTGITCSNDSTPTPTVTIAPTSGECSDMDGDRTCDSSDNCPTVSNADQSDRDSNGVGDACDAPITPTMGQHETSCRDGLDNDGDGYVDYDDSDCEPAFNFVKSVNARTDTDSYNHKLVPVTAGENVKCYIGNRLITPTATIQKTNDASGDLAPGSSVGYKIKVVISGNDVTNFKVTDLLSNGFVYRPGSYNVTKNGAPFSITEPVYHSPGVWDLGDLSVGDTIEMNYIADISLNQQPGSYTDLALARGEAKYESLTVYAQGENSQYTEGAFVGTLVPVVKSTQNSVSAGVEKHETSTGEVLGASTELPSTGSSTSWLIISTLMSLLGFLFIKKSNKKMLSIIFLLSFFLFPVSTNAVSNLSLRVEEPKTPTNINNVELNFVALDITGAPITVKCMKKSPSDAGFSQFGADIALTAGGNASHCSLSSILSSEGNYQFQVLASNGSDNVSSQIVNLDYKTSGPGTPNDYRKDRLNNCDYKIHFKSADDGGKTVKVEIYRADVTSFILDPGSVVSTVYTGSNTEHDINNSVPDCSKTYYYVLRAFDSAGNGSGTTGDSVTITTTSTTTLGDGTTTTTGAIPVVNVTLAPGEGESTTDETTGNLGENDGQGSVLGAQEAVKSFFQKYWLYLVIALIITVGIIRYVLSKKKKTRRR